MDPSHFFVWTGERNIKLEGIIGKMLLDLGIIQDPLFSKQFYLFNKSHIVEFLTKIAEYLLMAVNP